MNFLKPIWYPASVCTLLPLSPMHMVSRIYKVFPSFCQFADHLCFKTNFKHSPIGDILGLAPF
jgi:hypothetical protein